MYAVLGGGEKSQEYKIQSKKLGISIGKKTPISESICAKCFQCFGANCKGKPGVHRALGTVEEKHSKCALMGLCNQKHPLT